MARLTKTERVRVANLGQLQSRTPGAGSPTAVALVNFLHKHKVSITRNELSDIYGEKRAVSDYLAANVERAFDLPAGWLSEDHDFIFAAAPGEMAALRKLFQLPEELRQSILAVATSAADSAR